jgi:hypothetical protein
MCAKFIHKGLSGWNVKFTTHFTLLQGSRTREALGSKPYIVN